MRVHLCASLPFALLPLARLSSPLSFLLPVPCQSPLSLAPCPSYGNVSLPFARPLEVHDNLLI